MQKKVKYTKFDKVMFPIMNVLMLTLIFVLLKELFTPSTYLEYFAIIFMTSLTALPIANMNRKEIKEFNEVAEMDKANRGY